MITCTCCGSELTAPTIINGKPYGYTCATKIEGGKVARKEKLVEVVIAKQFKTKSGHVFKLRAEIVDTSDFLMLPCDNTGTPVGLITIDNKLFLKVKR